MCVIVCTRVYACVGVCTCTCVCVCVCVCVSVHTHVCMPTFTSMAVCVLCVSVEHGRFLVKLGQCLFIKAHLKQPQLTKVLDMLNSA